MARRGKSNQLSKFLDLGSMSRHFCSSWWLMRVIIDSESSLGLICSKRDENCLGLTTGIPSEEDRFTNHPGKATIALAAIGSPMALASQFESQVACRLAWSMVLKSLPFGKYNILPSYSTVASSTRFFAVGFDRAIVSIANTPFGPTMM